MINKDKVIVIDLDGTITKTKKEFEDYSDVKPREEIVNKLKKYRENGFYIIIDTSRNMRSFEGNIGKINAITSKKILLWLDKHQIPYDEIHVGKPWCGNNGFYVDDKTVRPSEFLKLSLEEIHDLINKEKNEE